MTPNKEDYLKEIYKLGGGSSQVKNKQISDALHISPASTSEMLSKLSKDGYIEYEPYKGICLTKKGILKSTTLLRSHRLWEVFLARHLGYPWSEVHEDAELLEHVTPPRLVQRLDEYLNHPCCCPHGFSIPQSNGQIETIPLRTLNQMCVAETSHIRRVLEDAELLDYLQNLGVEIGSQVTVTAIGAYEGPLTLDLGDRQVQISYKAACNVYVDEKQTLRKGENHHDR